MERKTFLQAAGAALATLAMTACGQGGQEGGDVEVADLSTVKDGKLIVVSDLAYPPLEMIPEGKTQADAQGYEVELVAAIAQKLGLEPQWEQVKFDTIVPLIKQGGRADMGASAITITDERQDEIDFSDPFLDSNQGMVMKKDAAVDDPTTALNNAESQIAVQSGTTGEAWVRENMPQATVVPLDDAIQAMTGVQTGLYQACVADLPVMAYLCTEGYTDLEVVEEIPTGEQYGLAISKDNPQLTEAVNKAYQELVDDGTVAKLQEKWFGQEL